MRSLSDNLHSAVLATTASLIFTINDGLMKYILAEFDLFVSLVIRGLFALPMLAFFYLYEKNLFVRLSKKDSLLLCGRAAGEMALTYCLLTALMQMPLATLTALLQSSPLFLSLVAFICFGERFGWRRWAYHYQTLRDSAAICRIIRAGYGDFYCASRLSCTAIVRSGAKFTACLCECNSGDDVRGGDESCLA